MMCNYMGNERWLEVLDSSFQSEYVAAKTIPWVTAGSGKLAGTVRSAGGKGFSAGNVTFVTVFEAGCVFVFLPGHSVLIPAITDTWFHSISRKRLWICSADGSRTPRSRFSRLAFCIICNGSYIHEYS
jgi:hypothetical protein